VEKWKRWQTGWWVAQLGPKDKTQARVSGPARKKRRRKSNLSAFALEFLPESESGHEAEPKQKRQGAGLRNL
jgi:hypothetical protein